MLPDVSVQSALAEIAVDKAMHPGVLTCPPETRLRDVARMMARYRVHAVVVYSDDDESDELPGVWGVVSDVDLLAAAALEDVEGRTAGGSAKSPLLTVGPEDTLQRAAELMKQHGATHLVVVSPQSERPLGIVSTMDLARAIASEPAHGLN
jgi:CBS domain-containing protein